MEYNPIHFTGETAQEIHSAVLEANRTAKRKLLRPEDNIKNERVLTSISGKVKWQRYKEKIRESDVDTLAANNGPDRIKFGDRKVLPKKVMAFDNWTMDNLRSSRFGKSMQAGAANIGSTEFEQATTSYLIPRMGKSYEELIYQSITAETKDAIANSGTIPAAQKAWAAAQEEGEFDGLIAKLITANNSLVGGGVVKHVVAVAGGVNTSNIVAEYARIYAQIDKAELEEGLVRIFAPLEDYQTMELCNLNQEFKDKFKITGQGEDTVVTFANIPVEFVPTGGPRFAGRAGEQGDFVHATDLESDTTEFKVDKVNNMSDDLFFKMVAAADTTVLNSSRKVLYI
ncbi:hypothetical protein [Hymenobacter pini]|uniref:hypothetical protein n=1 Tax=Hymenobacter pini TaxID=2880879 RepID=UPI001CF1EF79|nr:hypothetical protein [Hymenobacter pini]MCA8829436.1 hypothetical protein [Hymenobacter pini]